jgi:hypothetical protein
MYLTEGAFDSTIAGLGPFSLAWNRQGIGEYLKTET